MKSLRDEVHDILQNLKQTSMIRQTRVAGGVKSSKMGLGQDEQLCTLSVDMFSGLYSTLQLPGAGLASVEVLLTLPH